LVVRLGEVACDWFEGRPEPAALASVLQADVGHRDRLPPGSWGREGSKTL